MCFAQNDTSPELRAFYQGQGDAAFFSRLRDYLSQRVSPHLEKCRQVQEALQEEVRIMRPLKKVARRLDVELLDWILKKRGRMRKKCVKNKQDLNEDWKIKQRLNQI